MNVEAGEEEPLGRAKSANNNFTGNIISVIGIGALAFLVVDESQNFPPHHSHSTKYSPTSARITVSKGAIGNRTATLNSSI